MKKSLYGWLYFSLLFLVSLTALLLTHSVSAAPTLTLTATPTQGIAPLSVTLNWSSTGADSCTASGAWEGSKAVSGSEVLSLLKTSTFTLTCSASTGSAELSWTAPTQNVDGTAIPATGAGSLMGFKLYHAPTAAGVPAATPVVLDKGATHYTLTGLPAGARYYGLKAFNVEGVESDMAGPVNNVVQVPAATATASVTVAPKPKPPGSFIVVVPTVYDTSTGPDGGLRLGRVIGTAERGTACGPTPVVRRGGRDFHAIPIDAVNLRIAPRSAVVVAACAPVS